MYKGEPAGHWVRFGQQEFTRDGVQDEEEERETAWLIEDILRSESEDRFPRTTSACKFCDYNEICRAAWDYPKDKELILNQYKVKEAYDAGSKGIIK